MGHCKIINYLRSVIILDHVGCVEKVFDGVFVSPEQIAILTFRKQIITLYLNKLLLVLSWMNLDMYYLSNPLQILFPFLGPNKEQNPFVNAFQNQLEAFPKN